MERKGRLLVPKHSWGGQIFLGLSLIFVWIILYFLGTPIFCFDFLLLISFPIVFIHKIQKFKKMDQSLTTYWGLGLPSRHIMFPGFVQDYP